MSNFKKNVLIDLDGVLNTYTGDFDENFIPPLREGALDFVKNLSVNYNLKLFTSRNKVHASEWLFNNGLHNYIEGVTNIKEPSYLIIDDRCINFNGNYKDLRTQIDNFKIWYK